MSFSCCNKPILLRHCDKLPLTLLPLILVLYPSFDSANNWISPHFHIQTSSHVHELYLSHFITHAQKRINRSHYYKKKKKITIRTRKIKSASDSWKKNWAKRITKLGSMFGIFYSNYLLHSSLFIFILFCCCCCFA